MGYFPIQTTMRIHHLLFAASVFFLGSVWLPHPGVATPENGPESAAPEEAKGDSDPTPDPSGEDGSIEPVYLIPIHGGIHQPTLFIIRRALKEAIEEGVETVLFDIDTPGGLVSATLEIMEAIDRFPGTTISFINSEAISAGAYIAMVTDQIYFNPRGIIGAAEVVAGGGQEIPEAQKRKLDSYLGARQRVFTREYADRADILRAMSDPDFVFELDDRVIKGEGELLTLTADEAMETFGDPPRPLLGAGIHEDVDSILNDLFGAGQWEIRDFEITWSENLAQYLAAIAPALLGIGLLLLFIEFKTPGFGVFGFSGISMLLLVFASSYIAGLAGHEPVIFFALGVALVFVEILLLPGVVVFALTGILLILGSLIWAMSDIWPGVASDFSLAVFQDALTNLLLGALIAIAGAVLLARYLPKSMIWNRLVLEHVVGQPGESAPAGGASRAVTTAEQSQRQRHPQFPSPGSTGVTTSDLYPNGEVEIEGKRYQGRAAVGMIRRGTEVRVVAHEDFAVRVEPVD